MKPQTKKFIGVAGVTFGVAVLSVVGMRLSEKEIVDDIPLPFGFEHATTSLAGSVSQIGVKNGVVVQKVLFPEGTDAEALQVDQMYLVRTPDDDSIAEVPLDAAFSTASGGAVHYFGYKYSSVDALLEKTNKTEALLTDRFPGLFFASAKARAEDAAYGDAIANFELVNNLVMSETATASGAMLTKNSLYFFIVNEASGATLTVREPDTPPRLVVTGKTMASSDTAVANQQDVPLFRFEAMPFDVGNVLLTQLAFASATHSDLANAQNFTLWADTNADGQVDTILEQGVTAQNNRVLFGALAGGGYNLPADQPVPFEVHADIASSLLEETPVLSIRFDTGSTFLSAEETSDGSPLVGIQTFAPGGVEVESNGTYVSGGRHADIVVSTVVTTSVILSSEGDLFVSKSATPLRTRQLLAGTLESSILHLTFHAEKEDVDVTLLRFSTVDHDVVSADRLEMYRAGEDTPFAFATAGACGTGFAPGTFCASMQGGQLIVQAGAQTDVLIRPLLKTDANGAVSELFQLAMLGSMAEPAVEARGVISSNTLTPTDGDAVASGEIFIGRNDAGEDVDIVGQPNVVVFSKLASIENANPNVDGTAVPTGVASIGEFRFTALAHANTQNGLNTWTLSGLMLTVDATNIAFDDNGFRLYNKIDAFRKSVCSVVGSSSDAQFNVACPDIVSQGVQTSISSAANETFVLEAVISNAQVVAASGSALRVSIGGMIDATKTSFAPDESHVHWLDVDAGSSTAFFWIDSIETDVFSTQYLSGATE